MQSSELRWDDVDLAQPARRSRSTASVPPVQPQGKKAVSFDLKHENSEASSESASQNRSSLANVGLFPVAKARQLPEGRPPRYQEPTIPQGIRELARSPQPTDLPDVQPEAQARAQAAVPHPDRQSQPAANTTTYPARSPQPGKLSYASQADHSQRSHQLHQQNQPRSPQAGSSARRESSLSRYQTPPRLSPEAHARAAATAKYRSPDEPKLPRFRALSPRPQAAPAKQPAPRTAMNLLRDVEATVILWQDRLHHVANEVRRLYDEGPIVEGWLETRPVGQPAGRLQPSAAFAAPAAYASSGSPDVDVQNYAAGVNYFVCKRDPQGRTVSYPCPVEQVASVSLAISRYQKLQHLQQQKRQIEHRLAKIAEILVVFHGQIRAIGGQ